MSEALAEFKLEITSLFNDFKDEVRNSVKAKVSYVAMTVVVGAILTAFGFIFVNQLNLATKTDIDSIIKRLDEQVKISAKFMAYIERDKIGAKTTKKVNNIIGAISMLITQESSVPDSIKSIIGELIDDNDYR